jgi:hypothetical protein
VHHVLAPVDHERFGFVDLHGNEIVQELKHLRALAGGYSRHQSARQEGHRKTEQHAGIAAAAAAETDGAGAEGDQASKAG